MKELFKLGGSPKLSKTTTTAISICGLILLIGLWQLVCTFNLVPTKILPSPLSVISSIPEMFAENHLLANIGYSIKMNLLAYIYAICISLPLGLLIAIFPINNLIIGKYINSIRYLPVPAISGIFIAIFGLTFTMKTNFLAFGLLIFILPAVAAKVNSLQNPNNDKDNVHLQTAKTFGASGWQTFRDIYWPFVTSSISDEIINLTSISWSYVTIAEMLYRDGEVSGIGALINTMIRQSNMAGAYACLFIILIIGVCQDFLLKGLDKILFPSKYNRKSLTKNYYEPSK